MTVPTGPWQGEMKKQSEVRDLVGAPSTTPLVTADASDPDSSKMVKRAQCICTTVGPYQLYGSELAVCAEEGTHYVDLSESPLDAREDYIPSGRCRGSGARIVHSCGFDSIPFDLGVYFPEGSYRSNGQAHAPCAWPGSRYER